MVAEQIDDWLDGDDEAFEGAVYVCRSTDGMCPDSPQGGCPWCYRIAGDDTRTDEEIADDMNRTH